MNKSITLPNKMILNKITITNGKKKRTKLLKKPLEINKDDELFITHAYVSPFDEWPTFFKRTTLQKIKDTLKKFINFILEQ